jgi:Fungal specific transcription factor domain
LGFSNTIERQRIWQFIVPQIAFSHDFLLHFILAFAALHLSRLQPERKELLRDSSAKHYNTASSSFRHAILNITRENSGACFACSTFVLTYSWASSDNTGNLFFVDTSVDKIGKESTAEWVRLLRGVHSFLDGYWHWVKEGPLGPLLDMGKFEEPSPTEETLEYTEKFNSLKQLWDPERPSKTSTAHFTDHDVEDFEKTLELLKSTYGVIVHDSGTVDTVGVIHAWPIRVPESFIQMVNQQRPEALILLAHYCLLLNKVDHLWWIQGMSRHLLQTIHKALGQEWESWIVWPLQDLVLSEFRNSGKDDSQYGLPVREH